MSQISSCEKSNWDESLLSPVSWTAQIDFINHLLLFNNMMLVALAEQQGGKSSYVSFLKRALSDSFHVHATKCLRPFNETQIATDLAKAIQLSKARNTTLSDLCRQVNERCCKTLLILDDAQNLSEDTLRYFLSLLATQGSEPYFHILLVSDYSLVPSLNFLSESDSEDMIHSIEIGPFSSDEVKTYLSQKLTDSNQRSQLNLESSKLFFDKTQGNIAAMNREIQTFFNGFAINRRSTSVKLLRMSAMAALAAAVGFWTFQLLSTPTDQPHNPIAKINQSYQLAKTLVTNQYRYFSEGEKPVDKTDSDQVSYVEPISVSFVAAVKAFEKFVSIDSKVLSISVQSNSSPVKKTVTAEVVDVSSIASIPEAREAIYSTRKDLENSPMLITQLPPMPDFSDIEIQDNVASSVTNKKMNSSFQPKYTIQLVASHHDKFLKSLEKSSPIAGLLTRTVLVHQGGEQWYILTAGQFNNWKQANDAMSKLPKSYQKYQPWIRPIKTVG